MTKLYSIINSMVNNGNEVAAKATLSDKFGIEHSNLIWGCYKAVEIVSERKRPEIFDMLLEARREPMPEIPGKETGDVLFGVAYSAFPLEDGTVIPNGMTVKYSYKGRDYSLNKTTPEYVKNILTCYNNTKNETIRSKFELMVNGHEFVDPRIMGAEVIYWRDTPIFKALRKSREVDGFEFNPFTGLNEEEAALLNVQRQDCQDRTMAKKIIAEAEAIVNRKPEEARELIELIMAQFADMTDRAITQKRCQPLEAYDIQEEGHGVRVLSPEAEYRWELLTALKKAVKTNKKGTNDLVGWLSKYAPTETAKKPNVKGNSFKIARAIGYSEACKLYFQKSLGDDWKEGLAILLAYSEEANNAYFASTKILEELKRGASISKAINASTYDVFIEGVEQIENKEADVKLIEAWLASTKLAKYDKVLGKIERLYREARELQFESRQVEILDEIEKLRELEEQGLKVVPERFESLRKQNMLLSAKLEKLREQQ